MKKKAWLKIFKSFKEAERSDVEYYSKMTPNERVEAMQMLREMAHKIGGKKAPHGGKRLRRTIKVIQQKQS
ncbi:MAG: hypothetical protein KKH83_00125 [Candidatus Margulisbacteria bacterium]|nr:hypothetical protein [Candidatus Margulisiibacteriota bacterium]